MNELPDLTKTNCRSRIKAVIEAMGIEPRIVPIQERPAIESPELICVKCERSTDCPVWGFHEWESASVSRLRETFAPISEHIQDLAGQHLNMLLNGVPAPFVFEQLINTCLGLGYWAAERGVPARLTESTGPNEITKAPNQNKNGGTANGQQQ